jgi:hypothetical protein
VRIVGDFEPKEQRYRPSAREIVSAMNRIMKPKGVAVIGASPRTARSATR